MEVEIYLDLTKTDPDKLELVEARVREWYAEGAAVRYDKRTFGRMTVLEGKHRYLVDLGGVDSVTAIRELHATLSRFGVKVFVHFLH